VVSDPESVTLHVLGTAQDAGYPHPGCLKPCCERPRSDPKLRRRAACLAILDAKSGQRWLFEATPDFPSQLDEIDRLLPQRRPLFSGIFLTHAHLGHYLGLVHLGRESLGTRQVPTYVMPKMRSFLEQNGPWRQLIELQNIELRDLVADQSVSLGSGLSVTPLTVPHRGEFSETVAFRIQGPHQSVLFLPDIDRWEDWDRDLPDVLADVDVAYLDATFYSDAELPGRQRSEIPHPPICVTMERLRSIPETEKAKVRFIHFNHSNPVLAADSPEARVVREAGFGMADEGEVIRL